MPVALVTHLPGQHRQSDHAGVGRTRWHTRIQDAVASGVASSDQLSDPGLNQNDVYLESFNDGAQAIHKIINDGQDVGRGLDAEELAVPVAKALGLDAPEVFRASNNEAYYTVVPQSAHIGFDIEQMSDRELKQIVEDGGHFDEVDLDDSYGQELVDMALYSLTRTDSGIRMGLLDVLTHNLDRNNGNWFLHGDDFIPIDHGQSWLEIQPPDVDGRPVPPPNLRTSEFVNHFIATDGDADVWIDNDLSPEYVASLRTKLAETKPEFDRLGRSDWHKHMMDTLDVIGEHAKGGVSL